jgi:hypothetical protein
MALADELRDLPGFTEWSDDESRAACRARYSMPVRQCATDAGVVTEEIIGQLMSAAAVQAVFVRTVMVSAYFWNLRPRNSGLGLNKVEDLP